MVVTRDGEKVNFYGTFNEMNKAYPGSPLSAEGQWGVRPGPPRVPLSSRIGSGVPTFEDVIDQLESMTPEEKERLRGDDKLLIPFVDRWGKRKYMCHYTHLSHAFSVFRCHEQISHEDRDLKQEILEHPGLFQNRLLDFFGQELAFKICLTSNHLVWRKDPKECEGATVLTIYRTKKKRAAGELWGIVEDIRDL